MEAMNESQDYLVEAKNQLLNRNQISDEIDKMHAQQKKMVKNIASEEKSIADEIASTIKKSRQAIVDTYEDRLDENHSKKKGVLNKRDKKKNQRMNARIDEETKDTREKIKDLESEMKGLIKRERVSKFISSKTFFTMFMPRGIGETVAWILSLAVYFVGVPTVFRLLVRKAFHANTFFANLVFVLVFVLLVVIYVMIYRATLGTYNDVCRTARKIQNQIKANKREVKSIKKSITKDEDESQYNLEAFDEKIADLESEADSINQEKEEKLREFDEQTTQLITDEINERRLPALEQMKAECQNLENFIAAKEQDYAKLDEYIREQFVSRLGEELCKPNRIDDLIAIMEEGKAKTVTESVEFYKAPKSK